MIVIKRVTSIRVISFFSAVVIALFGFLIKSNSELKDYKLQLENNYSGSLDEFNAAINNVSLLLNKIRLVSTSQQLSQISVALLTEAETSKAALSRLPYNSELPSLNKFLTQVGSYSVSVSKKLMGGIELNQEDENNLIALSKAAKEISAAVTDTHITYNNHEYWARELENRLENKLDDGLTASLEKIEGELTDLPTLIYDGPYSDHIYEKEPAMLQNAQEVSEYGAKAIASEYCEVDQSQLKLNGLVEGNIPSYRFMGDGIYTEVSRLGGYVVYLRRERQINETLLSYEQAIEKAKRFLNNRGLSSFITTYYYANEGVCTINFAFLDGKTICYTDLVKVGVAMDNGEIMLYEASGYISNHTDRAFETAVYTQEQAAQVISDKLEITSVALALIPTKSGGEARCYEFTCKTQDEQEILVYINALTLVEEELFILLKGDGGTLVK